MLKKNRFPFKNEGKLTGVVLIEIVDIVQANEVNYEALKLSIKASNLIERNKECKITLFESNYGAVEISEFLNFFSECSIEELKGKLFYADLKLNKKGFLEISKLFLEVEKLIYDPRVKREIVYDTEEDLDIFSD
ncbi:MAG: hypothetical protein ACRC0Y_09780 [Fusobacteriaceae bacterium]